MSGGPKRITTNVHRGHAGKNGWRAYRSLSLNRHRWVRRNWGVKPHCDAPDIYVIDP
jgi:hypothetical protein